MKWGHPLKDTPHFTLMIARTTRGINMFTPQLGRYIKGVEYASMTSLLQDFRQQLSTRTVGQSTSWTEVNAVELISDLCVFLGLSDQNRRKVLGAQAATHLDQS